ASRRRPAAARRGGQGATPATVASLLRDSEDDRHRTMVVRVVVGHAPVEVVVARGTVRRLLALVAVALAVAAAGLAATVVVGNDVVAPVAGVVTGPDPGDGRGRRPGGAGGRGAPAAGAQEAVNRAVLPVVAALGAGSLGFRIRCQGAPAAVDWQQWQQRRPGQYLSQAREQAAARGAPRQRARRMFK